MMDTGFDPESEDVFKNFGGLAGINLNGESVFEIASFEDNVWTWGGNSLAISNGGVMQLTLA